MATMPLRRDTRVFISAVTRELGTVRKLVKKALEDSGYHAVATARLLRSPLLTGVLVRLLASAPALAGPIVQALNRYPALP